MAYTFSATIAILAIGIAVIFVFRGLTIVRGKLSRYIIFLPYLWISLVLFPGNIPPKIIPITGSFIVILAAIVIIADFVLDTSVKIKKNVFGKDNSSQQIQEYLIEISNAMGYLASQRTGGLVVIEKDDNLGESIGGGMSFDAEIKAEILAALFDKNSAVHDGAVIVRNGRIVKVKAILPVRMDSEFSTKVGTRHRAAVGITEKTDAVAVVVSEERGEVSVAHKGILSRMASKQELLQALENIFKKKKVNLFGFLSRKEKI